jgi:hypothetical protein
VLGDQRFSSTVMPEQADVLEGARDLGLGGDLEVRHALEQECLAAFAGVMVIMPSVGL